MKNKRIIALIAIALLLLSLLSCSYKVPKGYTRAHHPYERALMLAREMDPDARVKSTPADLTDGYGYKYREWSAVIKGVNCSVASCARLVFGKGLVGSKTASIYYELDTDYGYIRLTQILSQNAPEWSMKYTGVAGRYPIDKIYTVEISPPHEGVLSRDELLTIWETAKNIYDVYEREGTDKKIKFVLSAPDDSDIYITDPSDSVVESFINDYMNAKEG